MKFSKWTVMRYILTRVSIILSLPSDTGIQIVLQTAWHDQTPAIDAPLPGYEPVTLVVLTREEILT